MEKDLSHYRKSYNKGELLLSKSPKNPITLFTNWFEDIDAHFKSIEANAMNIATISKDGFPKSRIVLLKKYSNQGFIFYTNYKSEKGRAIKENNNVCLSFFWAEAERQIIIKGKAEKISEDDSNTYFASRPKGSQIGAVVSHQSEVIENRKTLEAHLKATKLFYKDKPIERPNVWGGYNVKPISIEFWQGRENRLHDRILYKLDAKNNWIKTRLQP